MNKKSRDGLVCLSAILILLPSSNTMAIDVKVLILGNSFTYYNGGIHTHLTSLATSLGDNIEAGKNTRGGWLLQDHYQDAGSRSMISNGGNDWVFLQDQSSNPIVNNSNFRLYSGLLDTMVQENGGQTAFFQTS